MRVCSVTVCPDRVDVVVQVDQTEPMRTSAAPAIASGALEVLPGLARHRCTNDDARPFKAEIADTELPHLFEHIVLELMAEAGSRRDLKGETEWDFKRDGRGTFRVSLEYDDDLVCLGAIKTAERVVAHLLEGSERPDVSEEIAKLAELRQWPEGHPA